MANWASGFVIQFLGGLPSIFSLGVNLDPVLKLVCVKFPVQVRDTLVQSHLRVCDGLVVNRWADFLEKEVEQQACGKVADRFGHVFFEITSKRGDRICTNLLGDLDLRHPGMAPDSSVTRVEACRRVSATQA